MSESSEAQVSPQLQQFIMQEQAKAQVIYLMQFTLYVLGDPSRYGPCRGYVAAPANDFSTDGRMLEHVHLVSWELF